MADAAAELAVLRAFVTLIFNHEDGYAEVTKTVWPGDRQPDDPYRVVLDSSYYLTAEQWAVLGPIARAAGICDNTGD